MAATVDTENFCKPDGPRYEGSYAGGSARFSGELNVVSWNIKFAREIDTAIAELNETDQLRNADIMLLQEMDDEGVDAIARSLGLNYVYFPASVHCRTGKKFGNAVLARWEISGSAKLLLPHESPRTGERRIAARAHVAVDGRDVVAYSVHTETFALSARKRYEQFRSLVDDIAGEDQGYVLVGGDFNTIKAKNIKKLEERFRQVGLRRVSAGAGPTLKAGFMSFTFDHIFVRGMAGIDNRVWKDTAASDHFPVWQRLLLQ